MGGPSLTGEVATAQWRRLSLPASAAVFALWALWLDFEYIAFGPHSFVLEHDTADSRLPALIGLAHQGTTYLTTWSPQWATGVDLQALELPTPLEWAAFGLLPGWLAYGGILLLQRFVAGWFMHRLLTERLGVGNVVAAIAGATYALFWQPAINLASTGFTLSDGLWLAGLPFILWAVTGSGRYRVGASLAVGAAIGLTSSPFGAIFMIPLLVIWIVTMAPRPWRGMLVSVSAVVAAFVVLSVVPLAAGLANSAASHRAHWPLVSPLSSPESGAQMAASLIASNPVQLTLALGGLFGAVQERRRLAGLLLVLGSILGFVAVYPLLHARVADWLGPFAGFQFDRIYLLVPFLAAVAGGLGLHALGTRLTRLPQPSVGIVARLAIVALMAGLFLQSATVKVETVRAMAHGSNYAVLFDRPELRRLAAINDSRQSPVPIRIASVPAGGFAFQEPAYAWAYGLETVDGYLPLYSFRYHEFWAQVIAPLTARAPAIDAYFRYFGSRIYLFTPGWPEGKALDVRSAYDLDLLSLAGVDYLVSDIPLSAPELEQLPLGLVNASPVGSIRQRLESWWSGTPQYVLYVYQNNAALPRFFSLGSARLFVSTSQELAALGSAQLTELQQSAFVLRSELGGFDPSTLAGSGSVTVDAYRAGHIELSVQSDGPQLVVATNAYSPYWRATVDSTPVRIIPVYETFQGVPVPSGTHRLVLDYSPPE